MWLWNLLLLLLMGTSWGFQRMFLGRPLTGFNQRRFNQRSNFDHLKIKGEWFDQILDHFDSTNNVTWAQRFWNNPIYYKSDGPQFLFMGQEGPSGPGDITGELSPHLGWAKSVNANLWELEHRFYGKSRPFEEQTDENLEFLTSRQYLEDVAYFIQSINKVYAFENPKWIVFGGSYSGSLALWFRQLYPELCVGAVGSSAPMQPQLDFYEYTQVMQRSIEHHDEDCSKNIATAFNQLGNLMEYVEGRNLLNAMFPNEADVKQFNLTSENIQNFYNNMIDGIARAVQYDCGQSCGIDLICEYMNIDSSNKALNLALIVSQYNEGLGDYNEIVTSLKNPSYDDEEYASTRSWTWQTCNEFGFFQTTNGGFNFFGSKIPLNYFVNLCADVFGEKFTINYVQSQIAKTVEYYGGIEGYNGTNVVAPRGSIDPWSALALKSSDDPTVIPYLIEEGSHCSDMHDASDDDNESLKNLRALIFENVKKWIGYPRIDEPTPEPSKITVASSQKKAFNSVIDWTDRFEGFDDVKKSSCRVKNFLKRTTIYDHFRNKYFDNANEALGNITEHRITQPVDHFNKSDSREYAQKFTNNDIYYKPGGPIFLLIGGESDNDGFEIVSQQYAIMQWAEKHDANTYFLEHRGYGDSLPGETPTLENLQYISSEQALADIANFMDAINLGYQEKPKWITFGGSYPGSLSAWFRQNYPQYTVGAVASSAPLEPKMNFFEYLQIVQEVITEYSLKCLENLGKAFADFESKSYSVKGRKILNKLFGTSFEGNHPDMNEIREEMITLYYQFETSVQYGKSFESQCAIMTNDSNSPLENLANLHNIQREKESAIVEDECEESGWNEDTSWVWQTCNEFGWFQTTDIGRNIFGDAEPLNSFIEKCFFFGKDSQAIADGIAKTKKNYGGISKFNATNIVLVNGSNDPWHALGLYTENTSLFGMTSILINGTSHCQDMYGANDAESPELKAAHQKIGELIEAWLNQASSV